MEIKQNMPICIGYPISKEEATRLLVGEWAKLDVTVDSPIIQINLMRYGLGLYYNDKGQFVLGTILESIGSGHDLLSVDETISKIIETKINVKKYLTDICSVNMMSSIEITPAEGITRVVHNPDPYLIIVPEQN